MPRFLFLVTALTVTMAGSPELAWAASARRLYHARTGATALAQPAAPARRDLVSVTGSLTYRQRIALPADSRVLVELRDVTTAPSVVVTERRTELRGRQVPVSFQLVVDRARLTAGRTYVVRGSIASAGRTTWTSEEIVVDPMSGPVDVGPLPLAQVKVAGTPPAAAPLAAFTATGHEPGWRLDIVGGRITLAADYGATRITLPSPPGTAVPNGRTYAGKTGHHHVTVTILDGPCADAATGMPHPNTVEVVLDGRTLRGCGGDPASLLRATAWVVESLDGAAVRGGAPITLRFGDDGRVAGSASCNSFNARYAITGDGLEISQAAATMKACLPDVMTQEGAFLNALGAVERFETTAAGGLVLHAANSRRIVARRERALPVPQAASPPAPRFSDRVWKVSESSAVALGSLYVFLSEGTLVMTSPGSRPSLGSWTYDGRSLTMTEDGVRHRVDILEQGDARLRLRSHNPGGAVDVTLVPAEGGETRK